MKRCYVEPYSCQFGHLLFYSCIKVCVKLYYVRGWASIEGFLVKAADSGLRFRRERELNVE